MIGIIIGQMIDILTYDEYNMNGTIIGLHTVWSLIMFGIMIDIIIDTLIYIRKVIEIKIGKWSYHNRQPDRRSDLQYDWHNDDRNPDPHPPSFLPYPLHVSDFHSLAHTCAFRLSGFSGNGNDNNVLALKRCHFYRDCCPALLKTMETNRIEHCWVRIPASSTLTAIKLYFLVITMQILPLKALLQSNC